MIPTVWCSACRAILMAIVAVAGLLWWIHLKGLTVAWSVTLVTIKTCGGVVQGIWYVLRGGW